MSAKNSIKQFIPHSYYHLYNRGVEKRTIFQDKQDYFIFLSYLKTYLLPKETNKLHSILLNPASTSKEKASALKLLRMNNFTDDITLLAFCLMPNHFHLLIKQVEANTIDRFMNSLMTRYSMYFNRKYKRVGPLFQGLYKAVLVTTDEQLLHLSRYIHRNPASKGSALQSYEYSSYPVYLEVQKIEWVKSENILAHFSKSRLNSYQSFVENFDLEPNSIDQIQPLLLDYED